ncbi:SLATT domain-containing protein [Rossellomorea marisflavi]|uniref:SLATT domain-containing protein n=1 Tax=Rossellomorea marisflavi TaxID=189381 RepID=UPI003457A321
MKYEDVQSNEDVFRELRRRVSITRKGRIRASKRLRKKHEYFEKVTHLYSLVVLILSVWFINIPDQDLSLLVTKMLLILSLSLTFFTMFLGNKNYKERAGNFETNYQHLDVLLNKMDRIKTSGIEITTELNKGLHREYEKLLIEKENHHDIDYYTSSDDLIQIHRKKIKWFNFNERAIKIIVAIYPLLLLIFIILINLAMENLIPKTP